MANKVVQATLYSAPDPCRWAESLKIQEEFGFEKKNRIDNLKDSGDDLFVSCMFSF